MPLSSRLTDTGYAPQPPAASRSSIWRASESSRCSASYLSLIHESGLSLMSSSQLTPMLARRPGSLNVCRLRGLQMGKLFSPVSLTTNSVCGPSPHKKVVELFHSWGRHSICCLSCSMKMTKKKCKRHFREGNSSLCTCLYYMMAASFKLRCLSP
jgi:hypothetical protein